MSHSPRLHSQTDEAAQRAVRIRGSMTPEFVDANQLRIEKEALEEVQGYLRRMDLLTPSQPSRAWQEGRTSTYHQEGY